MKLDDKTVLKISSLATGAYGLGAWIAPEQHQDLYFEATAPRSNVATRWSGLGFISSAACSWTVATSDDPGPKTVKMLLKTKAILWSIGAAQSLYNAENGWQRKDVAYVLAAIQVAIAALVAWRGYAA